MTVVPHYATKDESNTDRGKIVAVVSGKGGSGKTMFAVALAQGAAINDKKAILVDTDFATGGLTYYLTFREFSNARVGLSDFLGSRPTDKPLSDWAAVGKSTRREEDWISNVKLAPIGDQRRFREDMDNEIELAVRNVLNQAVYISDLVVVDCRGGIDSQSIAVCRMADEIIVVVETDTTSIRASQHLADILSDENIKQKVVGFVLNKVMDDPTPLAKTASALLRLDYLGAIPFDIEATRSYIQGLIPDSNTLFARHVFAILPRIFSDLEKISNIRVLDAEEFGSVTLRSPETRLGGLILLSLGLYLSVGFMWFAYLDLDYIGGIRFNIFQILFVISLDFILFAGLSDAIKQKLGQSYRQQYSVFRLFSKLMKKY
ncbi:MAG: hypothetical protein BVN32_08915 [Proteobacteria bacterium ST_bin14]|nr:MAG: hypothetical protein BVN32_08915 [Proteobacteria bacterium ST_bin14]